MNEVAIVGAVRTPIGKIRGSLSEVRPDDMAALVIKEVVRRADIDPEIIEEVVLGCANQAGEDNRNIARMSLLLAGLPESVSGITVNRLCASGLSAVNQAARAIRVGEGEVYVAGGVESMTRAPYSFPKNPSAFGPSGNQVAYDTALGWRYPNANMRRLFPLEAMGETAENIVDMSFAGTLRGGAITRERQDHYAFQSHKRAIDAINMGYFEREVVPVEVPLGREASRIVSTDEHPRYTVCEGRLELDTSIERLGRLQPAFRNPGTVTAGNSSGLNDGACALLLMSAKKADALGLKPLAFWLGSASSGVNPRVMGLGPVSATRKVLARYGLDIGELDLVEVNEAFAAQALAVVQELDLSEDIVNVNGGAIALGHPLGCSGARILTTLVHEMGRRAELGQPIRYGLATLCVGVGQGEATLVGL